MGLGAAGVDWRRLETDWETEGGDCRWLGTGLGNREWRLGAAGMGLEAAGDGYRCRIGN